MHFNAPRELQFNILLFAGYLSGLSKLTSDTRSAIRKGSLEVLFNILKDHGHLFSGTFWSSVFDSVIFPIFYSLYDKQGTVLRDDHLTSSRTLYLDSSTWDSETSALASQCLEDLFFSFFDEVRSQLRGVISILTGFIMSPVQGPASAGVTSLTRMAKNLAGRLSDKEWQEIFLALEETASSSMFGFLKLLRTMKNIQVLDADLERASNDDSEDENLQSAAYIVSRMKSHIASQLLVMQVSLFLSFP